jgi:hypothetical protein
MKGLLMFSRAVLLVLSVCPGIVAQKPALQLNEQEYFELGGTSIMVYQDIYPEGHQGGISIIQYGTRVASNGDLRLEATPGQWQPIPKQDKRTVDRAGNEITVQLSYPDPARNRKGFNPIEYPDLDFSYQVRVKGEGEGFRVLVDLDRPLPAEWTGKVGFNLELYPALLFGKSWYLGSRSGIFPRQANGPVQRDSLGEVQAVGLGKGPRLVVAPEVDSQRLVIESRMGELQLLDGRMKHNNGWFIVRSLVPAGATRGAIDWLVMPNTDPNWKSKPVIHVSQVGYHPKQVKRALLELDKRDGETGTLRLKRISEIGQPEEVLAGKPASWGKFLRYHYFQFDFSQVSRPGMYFLEYRDVRT